jgi:hypothetical protein
MLRAFIGSTTTSTIDQGSKVILGKCKGHKGRSGFRFEVRVMVTGV